MIPMDFDNLLANRDMWGFQVIICEKWVKTIRRDRNCCWFLTRIETWSNPVQKFRLSFCNCKSCIYSCDDLLSYNSSPRSSLIWFSLIHNMIILSRVYNEPIQLSSTGRALHRYRRGQGFESRTSLNFFRLSFRNCKDWVYNCNYHFSYKCSNCRESDLLCDLPKALTDKIQACGWVRVTRILCARLKNASWVFSLGDFVLESLPCAQRWWILNLFSAHT